MPHNALRIGLLVPANNTTMHGELPAWLPAGTRCERIGIARGPGLLTLDTLPPYIEQAVVLARGFAGEACDAVVYGCTAAGILAGARRDAEIGERLAAVTGRPAVTTSASMVAWLARAGARRVALVTPYQDDVNERLVAFLDSAGIAVGALSSFRADSVAELARISAAQVGERARALMLGDGAGCDALFIACSQLPTHGVVEALAGELGLPVSSSIHATAWQVARRVGERVVA